MGRPVGVGWTKRRRRRKRGRCWARPAAKERKRRGSWSTGKGREGGAWPKRKEIGFPFIHLHFEIESKGNLK